MREKYIELLELEDNIKNDYSFPSDDYLKNYCSGETKFISRQYEFAIASFILCYGLHKAVETFSPGGEAIRYDLYRKTSLKKYVSKRIVPVSIIFGFMYYVDRSFKKSNPYSRGELN